MTAVDELLAELRSQPDLSEGLCVGAPELWSAPEDRGLSDRAIELCLSCRVYDV